MVRPYRAGYAHTFTVCKQPINYFRNKEIYKPPYPNGAPAGFPSSAEFKIMSALHSPERKLALGANTARSGGMRASSAPAKLFSSHHCLGGASSEEADLGSVDAPWSRVVRNQKERTCQFTNVCFDGQRQGWSYFADTSEFVGSRKRFSAGLDVWARGDFGFARAGPPASEDISFRLHRRPLPARARFLDAPLHVLIAPLAPSNFGHFLGNALYPAFAAAWRLFGAESTVLDYQLIFVGPNQTDLTSMRRRCLVRARVRANPNPNPNSTRNPHPTRTLTLTLTLTRPP